MAQKCQNTFKFEFQFEFPYPGIHLGDFGEIPGVEYPMSPTTGEDPTIACSEEFDPVTHGLAHIDEDACVILVPHTVADVVLQISSSVLLLLAKVI